MSKFKNKLPRTILIIALVCGCDKFSSDLNQPASQQNYRDDTLHIQQAFEKKQSNILVQSSGEVIKVLKDDAVVPRHQRFLVRLTNGQTLLISHNIDLAPRVENLKVNTDISFYGEYEYNDKGGVVHWTHHAPSGRHRGGWLEYKGKRYE